MDNELNSYFCISNHGNFHCSWRHYLCTQMDNSKNIRSFNSTFDALDLEWWLLQSICYYWFPFFPTLTKCVIAPSSLMSHNIYTRIEYVFQSNYIFFVFEFKVIFSSSKQNKTKQKRRESNKNKNKLKNKQNKEYKTKQDKMNSRNIIHYSDERIYFGLGKVMTYPILCISCNWISRLSMLCKASIKEVFSLDLPSTSLCSCDINVLCFS